jgi:6-phosphogluconolactonase
LYRLLTQSPYRDTIPWKKTFVLWSDERFVPLDDERSNAGNAKRLFLDQVPVPEDQVFPMYGEGLNPAQAAAAYEATIGDLFTPDETRLDLTLLGCGDNGHTASLFPHSPVLYEQHALVKAVEPAESDVPRITMTPRLLNQSRVILFIVYGEKKAEAVRAVFKNSADPTDIPARIIRPVDGRMRWLLDAAAASGITH